MRKLYFKAINVQVVKLLDIKLLIVLKILITEIRNFELVEELKRLEKIKIYKNKNKIMKVIILLVIKLSEFFKKNSVTNNLEENKLSGFWWIIRSHRAKYCFLDWLTLEIL